MRDVVEDTIRSNPGAESNEQSLAAAAGQVAGEPPPAGREQPPLPLRTVVEDAGLALDPEWLDLPRSSFLIEVALRKREMLVPREMFRSHQLNPRDVSIAPDARARFAAWLAARVSEIEALRATLDSVARQEFEHMQARGTARQMTYEEYVARLDASERATLERMRDRMRESFRASGMEPKEVDRVMSEMVTFDPNKVSADHFVHGVSGRTISWASLRELPQASQAAEMYAVTLLALGSDVVTFFVDRGCLATLESDAILRDVETAVSAARR